jgi:hypothetical protein
VTALATPDAPWQPPPIPLARVSFFGQFRKLSDRSVLICGQSDVARGPHPLLYGSPDPVVFVIGSALWYPPDIAAGVQCRTGGPAYLPRSADFGAAMAGGEWLAGTEETALAAAQRWKDMSWRR